MQNQMVRFIKDILYVHMYGYRKGYSAQHALLTLIERWEKVLDGHGHAGAIITYLSKAFDTINRGILLAKLYAYGFDKKSLLLIKIHLMNR